MTDIEKLTAAFQTMDQRAKDLILYLSNEYANKWQARPRTRLTLVPISVTAATDIDGGAA